MIRPGAGLHDPAVLLLLLSSAAYALYQIATRWVSFYDDAAVGIVFSALLGSLVMTMAMPGNTDTHHAVVMKFLPSAISTVDSRVMASRNSAGSRSSTSAPEP